MARLVFIDTETTGLEVREGHRIIEIALVEVVNGKLTGNQFQSYLDPEGKVIDPKAYEKHKIKNSFLEDKPLFADQLPAIIKFIGKSRILTYNTAFDLKMLDYEAERAGSTVRFSSDFKSTCVMKTIMEPMSRKRKVSLDAACNTYQVDTSERTVHGTLIDAQLAARVYLAFKAAPKKKTKVPQVKQRSEPEQFPLPRAYEGYQFNFCKNPKCKNYGVPPKFPDPRNLGKKSTVLGSYELTIKKEDGRLSLKCKCCKSSSVTISNKSVVQELKRLRSTYRLKEPSCPNSGLHPDKRKGISDGRRYEKIIKKVRGVEKPFTKLKPACPNHGKGILAHPELYWLDSKNVKKLKNVKGLPKVSYPDSDGKYRHKREAVSQTFKCKHCKTKFSAPLDPQKGQHDQQVNYVIFSDLITKSPINKIRKRHKISHSVIYARIQFFYELCIQFEQFQLAKNLHKLSSQELFLSMDRLVFDANWTSSKDARRTRLMNTCTVDNNTGYVLASSLNFDFTSDYKALAKEFVRIGEYDKAPHKRRYQQYILPDENIYDDPDIKTPTKHLLLHQTYSIISHLEMLKPFFDSVRKINLYSDDDSGMDFSITKVFKSLIVSKKLQACTTRKGELKEGETKTDRGFVWIPQGKPIVRGRRFDLLMLTDCDSQFIENAALYGVDNYFNSLRKGLMMVERPIPTTANYNDEEQQESDLASGRNKHQKWNLYGAYNPKYVAMLLEIFRVHRNFVETDADQIANSKGVKRKPTTPAQRVGLVEEKYDIHDILEFSVANEVLKMK